MYNVYFLIGLFIDGSIIRLKLVKAMLCPQNADRTWLPFTKCITGSAGRIQTLGLRLKGLAIWGSSNPADEVARILWSQDKLVSKGPVLIP